MDAVCVATSSLATKRNASGQFAFQSGRIPLYGFGINDASYVTQPHSKSRQLQCPYYCKWKLMVERCYSTKYHKRRPSYTGCSVCPDWKFFSNFRQWMESQQWEGRHLDKDLLGDGLRYSPEFCVFVRPEVNSFLTDSAASRGTLPIGVTLHPDGRFRARVRSKGLLRHLGLFSSAQAASDAWAKAKSEIAIELANQESDLRVAGGLRQFAMKLAKGLQIAEAR